MKIIKRREYLTNVWHTYEYEWADSPGAGFSFHCNPQGEIEVTEGNRANVERAPELVRQGKMFDRGVKRWEHDYVSAAIGECEHCGEEVFLDSFTNSCPCGTDYNMSGQMLAPREQWGEETGESLSEILSIR